MLIKSVLRFDYIIRKKKVNHIQLLEKTIILSFLSFDLYKLYKPSLKLLYKNMSNIDKKFHELIGRLESVNLFLLATQNPGKLDELSSQLIEFGKYLIIKRIVSQKVYMEKLSFMVDLITNGDTSRSGSHLRRSRACDACVC